MSKLKSFDEREIARRLGIERKIAGKTQEMAANAIGVSRKTLASFENGSRKIELEEILSLSEFYGISANQIMRPGVVHTDIVPRFRKLRNTKDEHVLEAIKLLNRLISAELELENILEIKKSRNYPIGNKIGSGDISDLADQHANELRKFLRIGTSPIPDIFSLIENELGIRLYQCPLSKKSKVSGLYAFDGKAGACILLNANHPRTRRAMSAAHELGHFFCNRKQVEVLEAFEHKSKEERYANKFGRAFLMPKDSFSKSYHKFNREEFQDQRGIFKKLAQHFHVSIQSCVLRLEDLKLVERETWKNLFARSDNVQEIEDMYQSNKSSKNVDKAEMLNRQIPYRLSVLAHLAWKCEKLSEGVLASMFNLGRTELREILVEVELEELEIDDMFTFENSKR